MKNDKMRNAIVHFFLKREIILKHLVTFALAITGFFTISGNYGYLSVLTNEWLIMMLSVICAFLPINIFSIIFALYISISLMGLSTGLCVIYLTAWLLIYIISKICGSSDHIHSTYLAVLLTINLPFISPLFAGYFGKRRDAIPVVGGACLAFFLRAIKLSEASFTTTTGDINSFGVLRENMFSNFNFYLFTISVVVVFMIITMVREIRIKNSWLIAGIIAIFTELPIMIAGYIFTNSSGQIKGLIISNIINLVLVFVISYLFQDIKVNRRRILDFEDDEYIYRVICTPKVRIENNRKKIKRITRTQKEIDKEQRTMELAMINEVEAGDNTK